MTEFMHDPDSLANLLDSLLAQNDGTIPAIDDPLIEAAFRLSAAPKPELKPEAFARIGAQILAAKNAPPTASANPSLSLPPGGIIVVIVVLIALVGGLLVFIASQGRSSIAPTNTPAPIISATTETTATPIPSTATTIRTETAVPTVTVAATI
ncbi:MAG: hypothetical protein H7Y09_01455, partial [Chitinophagaceae bacterium]|nr:hypothetical protein [Anaerolineae bacterium]